MARLKRWTTSSSRLESLIAMSALRRWAAFAVAATFLIPVAADAFDIDYSNAPFSSAPTPLDLCGSANSLIKPEACKSGDHEKLAAQIEQALQTALARAPATVRPLLKRDQAFFAEMIGAAAEDMPQSENPDDRKTFSQMLQRRVSVLQDIANGFGRSGVLGKWADAFGNIAVTPADDGAYRLAIDIDAVYGADNDKHWRCEATALLRPSAGGWLSGTVASEQAVPERAGANTPAAAGSPPKDPASIKIHRQGETLRVVFGETGWRGWRDERDLHCVSPYPITASYFASGKLDPAMTPNKVDTAFVAPTFDCTRPDTASDEETCSDPDLADNDQRLNRAWKALLPRLDEATRQALKEDQRNWVRAQANQYPDSLHPARAKMTYFMHYTSDARLELNRLQRARRALLEGFDENRKGFAGMWLSYTAILNVTPTEDGGLEGKGWKWEQGSWKDGCDYDIEGKVVGGVFRSDEQRKNPDTLERDRSMLIVNRQDDVFAKQRHDPTDSDEPKCRRSDANSSTARLFPAKPSPDISDFNQ
jgi:uncharacterized protein YecT (DUF1311 family)